MHDHTKQQLELFDKEFVKHIDDHTEPVFIDAVGSVGPIRQFIQQALKSQAKMIRDEMDSTIGSLNGLRGCEYCISKVNKQKANLDELINSFNNMTNQKSKCCGSSYKDRLSIQYPNKTDEELRGRTNYYICDKCGKHCDLINSFE